MKNVVLIDADSLCYIGKAEDTLQQIIDKVDYTIQSILDKTEADYYCLFISKGKYFRHNLKNKSEESGSYKSNRKFSNQNYSKVIKEYIIAKYNAMWYPEVEADDAVAYWYKNFNGDGSEKIIVSVDKDLLQSIPGKHLNYNKKTGDDTWEMVWIETSKKDAILFNLQQLIIGDSSDGVSGVPKKGIKYWEKMVEQGKYQLDTILFEYCSHYGISQGIYEFQKNYRLLCLLENDKDWEREVGYIPSLPLFQKVDKEESVNNEF